MPERLRLSTIRSSSELRERVDASGSSGYNGDTFGQTSDMGVDVDGGGGGAGDHQGRSSLGSQAARDRLRKERLSDVLDSDELLDDQHSGELPMYYQRARRQPKLRMLKMLVCFPCWTLRMLFQPLAGLRKRQLMERTISVPQTDDHKTASYPPNVICNQKYTLVSFVPKVFYEQFKYFFNLYFLLVALSQFIPALRIGYLFTYFGPLGFVLTITMCKELADDLKRKRRDKEANSQLYQVLDPAQRGLVNVPSSDLRVGDLVVVRKNQRIPADLVLLRTTEPNGACFVRTDQLDGETDWKLRIAVPPCQRLPSDLALLDLTASIYAEKPHKDIHSFIGNFSRRYPDTAMNDETEPLSVENTLWMNTVLASGDAVGCVLYTGQDTRAAMNTSHPGTKMGLIDMEINRLSKILFFVTLGLSLVMIALTGFTGMWYIYLSRFMILFSSIIPISLRVNLDMGKTVYATQIMRDRQIPEAIVRTSTLPEELGRVEYLLSDKTGTLTKNDMELKKIHLGTMSFGTDSFGELRRHLEVGVGGTSQDAAKPTRGPGAMTGKGRRDISLRVRDVVQALALCHNVTPVISDIDHSLSYQASSPDEIAIVKWTEAVGMTLVHRDINTIHLRPPGKQHDTLLRFEILQLFPFTSESKRMGIVIRDLQTGDIVFYQKGADAIMARIVQYNDWLDEECGNMAREGLRTLVIGRKRLSEEAYQEFESRYRAAKVSVHDRNAAVARVVSEMLEADLELLGVTGVEDKLQDDVKPTLEALRNAGVKIWMLTGDKIETATCIAVSSKLVSRSQAIFQMDKLRSPLEAQERLDLLATKVDCCLIIDGESLQVCLDHMRTEFLRATIGLPAVVCCRCSPTQKAEVTKMIKDYTGKRVCAIGDGGNDVSMIQAANVGVGIVGKEGKQASLAADFSIIQFSHLTRLLLWHGRNSYQRSAKLSQFVIHRGLIISIIQAVFSAIFFFAPIALYQGMLLVGYSTVYTMAPVFSLVLDTDVTDDIAMLYPELYKDLIKGRLLSFKTFFVWLLISVYQGGCIMLLALWLFNSSEFLNIVSISFTALVFNELLMVGYEVTTWHRYMVYAEVVTVLIYTASMFVLREFDLNFILTWSFAWKTAVITAASSFPLYIAKRIRHHYAPPSYQKLVYHHQ
ncbi:putative aminophospholipid-translocase [Sorochytrium milnesiophthora]